MESANAKINDKKLGVQIRQQSHKEFQFDA
jgi:hypothetical protein